MTRNEIQTYGPDRSDRVRRRHGGRGLRQQQQRQWRHERRRDADRTPSFNVQQDPSIASQVPADVKKSGELTVAADATYAPDEFIASRRQDGDRHGRGPGEGDRRSDGPQGRCLEQPFDSIIPGLAAGKYDLGMSSFTDTKEREKTVDFVTYAQAGESFFVNADGGPDNQLARRPLRAQGRRREGHHQRPTTRRRRPRSAQTRASRRQRQRLPRRERGQPGAVERAGRRSAWPTRRLADYAVKQSDGQFKLSPAPYANAPYGIAMAKDSGLAAARARGRQGPDGRRHATSRFSTTGVCRSVGDQQPDRSTERSTS